ncbi:MAG: YbjN domain-containing protein [Halieaceae bacterium]|nr:YbjN domain-containing protein [Halieaceae bacterium]
MADPQIPDRALLERWLRESHIDFEDCGRCEGLHLPPLRSVEGVIDSRLFLERYGLLLTTELEVRPMAVLPLSADMGRLNMDYPTVKVFLDVADDAIPQLVVAGVLPTSAGLTQEQVSAFVALTLEETRQLAADCRQLDYLFAEPEGGRTSPSPALH